jgi:hypothetical protein
MSDEGGKWLVLFIQFIYNTYFYYVIRSLLSPLIDLILNSNLYKESILIKYTTTYIFLTTILYGVYCIYIIYNTYVMSHLVVRPF